MQVSISSMFSEDVNHFIVKLCAFSETHTVLSWFHVVEIGSPLAYEDLKNLLQALKSFEAPIALDDQGVHFLSIMQVYDYSLLSQWVQKKNGLMSFPWVCSSTQEQAYNLLMQDRAIGFSAVEYQLQGRGRRGTRWHSGFSQNICFSISKRMAGEIDTTKISLSLGLVIVQVLRTMYPDIATMVKWPNDIYIGSRKLGGIIVESQNSGEEQVLVVGVGLNLYAKNLALHAVSLTEVTSAQINKTVLTIALADAVYGVLQQIFKGEHLSDLVEYFSQFDMLSGQMIRFNYGGQVLLGKASGIDAQGRYGVLGEQGRQFWLTSGLIHSVRLVSMGE